MAFSTALLRTPTPLEQLLEEINFQRTKEMRQLLKDDSGFVVLQGTTYWTDLFVRHFLFQDEQAIDCDDLLFFVRKKHVKGSSRYLPKYETSIDVFRKDSKKLPIGDPDIDWEETVYLNLIIHQFDYTLTLAICTRTSPKELQVLKRHSQKVYASPSRRKMDTKGEGEEITYPHICFMVDNFDEVFCDILVRDGEMVCVELVASDRRGTVQGVIFLGSIRYDALKKVYDSRQSSLSTKVAQRMTFGLFSSNTGQRCEFVRMKGPQGKGHAEMAVTRPRGSGAETPTSEPGFCATDMWDSDWDEDPDDFFVYRHQRRLSDPSANLNNFSRSGWKTKNCETSGAKSRSENEGLDSLANGVSEIEAGDVRDEQSSSNRPTSSPRCCPAPRTCCTTSPSWGDMSEVYSRDQDCANETPACLINVTPKKERPKTTPEPPPLKKQIAIEMKEITREKTKTHIITTNTKTTPQKPQVTKKDTKTPKLKEVKPKEQPKPKPAPTKTVNKTEKPPFRTTFKSTEKKTVVFTSQLTRRTIKTRITKKIIPAVDGKKPGKAVKANKEEYELADDATSLNLTTDDNKIPSTDSVESKTDENKIGLISDLDPASIINVNGKEELPCLDEIKTFSTGDNAYVQNEVQRVIAVETYTALPAETKTIEINKNKTESSNIHVVDDIQALKIAEDEVNGNDGDDEGENPAPLGLMKREGFCTLPRMRRGLVGGFLGIRPPKRTTPDGTDIYYWCDLPKKNELDDGAYNPLWTMRGFTQTFHFWKENKRQQSTPLNAFLTYVTLPWWSIAKDILDHREGPILTF